MLTIEEYATRVETIYKKREHFHCLCLDASLAIDGGLCGGEGRFINHSCEPNCHIEKWNVNGAFMSVYGAAMTRGCERRVATLAVGCGRPPLL